MYHDTFLVTLVGKKLHLPPFELEKSYIELEKSYIRPPGDRINTGLAACLKIGKKGTKKY